MGRDLLEDGPGENALGPDRTGGRDEITESRDDVALSQVVGGRSGADLIEEWLRRMTRGIAGVRLKTLHVVQNLAKFVQDGDAGWIEPRMGRGVLSKPGMKEEEGPCSLR